MFTNSDRYGDMDLEDVTEFEGLAPEDGKELNFLGRFDRQEVHTFEQDFESELGSLLDVADEGPTLNDDEQEAADYEAWVFSRSTE